MKKFIWDSNWELLLVSALRWEIHTEKECKVQNFIKENIKYLSPKAIHNSIESCKDTIPIDKELSPNVYKYGLIDFLSKVDISKALPEGELFPIDKNVEHIIDYATQYSIGRRTYMPSVVIEFIETFKGGFSDDLKNRIISTIENAKSLGDCGDPEKWLKLKEELREEVKQ